MDRPVLGKNPVGVVIIDNLVELPEVDMVGLEATETVLKVRLRILCGSSAALGHDERLLATAALGQGLAHPLLGDSVMIIPAIVHEGDPLIDGPLDQPEALG